MLRDRMGVMPPWFIEKDVGIQDYQNDISLSDAEITMIAEWADNGAPRGDPNDMPAPRVFAVEDEWDIGESLPAFDMFWEADITNVLSGDSEQLGYGEAFEVTVLECRNVIQTADNSRKTIVQTVICFHSPQLSLPDFSMRREEWHHKLRSKLGYQDIDFESHPTAVEFSKKYLLRGKDEQTIRALFTDAVLTFFAAHPDKVCVEGSDDQLIWYQPGKIIEPEDIPAFMKEGFEVFRVFARKQN